MDTIRQGRELRYGFAEQTDFGTPVPDDAAFIQVAVEHFDINRDIRIEEINTADGTINPTANHTVHLSTGGMANFTTNGSLNMYYADQFAYAHFHNVTEAASSPNTKTFSYFTSHPDFTANEGHCLTWIKRFPTASNSTKIDSCIAKSFKISGERDGRIMLGCDWVGLGAGTTTSNPSGTWSDEDEDAGDGIIYFNDISAATISGTWGPSAHNVLLRSFEIEGQYEVEKVGQSATDGYQTFGLLNRTGTFTINLLKDSRMDELLAAQAAGSMVTFTVDWEPINVNLTVTGKVEEIAYDPDGLLGATLTCRMLAADSSSSMFDFEIGNTIDRGW